MALNLNTSRSTAKALSLPLGVLVLALVVEITNVLLGTLLLRPSKGAGLERVE